MDEIAKEVAVGIAVEVLLKSLVKVGSLGKRQIALVRSLDANVELLRETLLPTAKELMLNARAPFLEAKFLRGLRQFSSNAEAILEEFDTHVAQCQLKGKRISRRLKWKVARKIKALFAEFEVISDFMRKAGVDQL